MTKNPFVWFCIKVVKLKPMIYFITLITTIILSMYIKDYFILLLGLLFVTLQPNIEMVRTCFLIPGNDVIFLTPFSPRSFLQKQSNAVWMQSFILIEMGLIVNMLIQHYDFFKIISFSVLIALFTYYFCLFICSIMSTLSVKIRKISINIMIPLVLSITVLVKIVSNEYIALIIMSIILFIFSHLSFKKLSFEKMLGGK